ncbi:metallophosphoesterase [Chthoniobacter flavus Ellin428]|uniref:Metallophosphoesterase n=1 Tax=Chthoniobacter flavus Ellin428 TaxID=497964 RepID=B4D6P9_9BACT|nr:metallophosphoesterase family protein [Chthoniobacter flavus]EDY17850.1 metallophosphoesterase [Chthoniobacter flavus Ellin428]TCO88462.1 putative phosphoesterase [Chthoniobacter flavus]
MDRTRLELEPGVWLDAERAVWLEEWRTLAVADLHLGYAWAHRAEGQLLPVDTGEDSTERLLRLLAKYPAEEVILLGDIVHRAVDVPALHTELRWLALNVGERARLRLIGGNHDRELAETLATANIVLEVDTHAVVGPHLLLHGDGTDETTAEARLSETAARRGRVILGHEHPAIGLSDGVASHVKCPCFVAGEGFLVLPAFSRWAAGGDIRSYRFMSPYARLRPAERAVAIVAGKLLPIPLTKR